MSRYVGTSMKRREDPRFIQGQGRYVANVQIPNMAYLAIKRSPYAHAKIKRLTQPKPPNCPASSPSLPGRI